MRTTEAVTGKWGLVFEHFGLPPITGKRHWRGEAPCCGQRGKYRCDDKGGNGTYICACGAVGDGWSLLKLVTGKPFGDLAREVDEIIGNVWDADSYVPQEKEEIPATEVDKYRLAKPIWNTQVEQYLQGRGITKMPKRAVKCTNDGMFAIATDYQGNPVFSHTTFITNGSKEYRLFDGNKVDKILLSIMPEQQREYATSVAVRLFEAGETLGVAEGIETALSASQIYRMPTWSTINSNYMSKFIAPKGVTKLYIFADNDMNGTGLAAAFVCGRKNILSAKTDVEKVHIRWTSIRGDFNDMLLDGADVYEHILERKNHGN